MHVVSVRRGGGGGCHVTHTVWLSAMNSFQDLKFIIVPLKDIHSTYLAIACLIFYLMYILNAPRD